LSILDSLNPELCRVCVCVGGVDSCACPCLTAWTLYFVVCLCVYGGETELWRRTTHDFAYVYRPGKELLVTDSFKIQVSIYTFITILGSFFADDGSMSREMGVRNVRALAAFHQFQDIRASPKPSNTQKMHVYRTFVSPIDVFGCETWTWTEV